MKRKTHSSTRASHAAKFDFPRGCLVSADLAILLADLSHEKACSRQLLARPVFLQRKETKTNTETQATQNNRKMINNLPEFVAIHVGKGHHCCLAFSYFAVILVGISHANALSRHGMLLRNCNYVGYVALFRITKPFALFDGVMNLQRPGVSTCTWQRRAPVGRKCNQQIS